MQNILEDNPLSNYTRPTPVFPLNQVLYGASGTGKTYFAPYYALAIVEGKMLSELQQEAHQNIMTRFRAYQQEGQIEWLTLHKNYSYTELIQAYQPFTHKKDGLWKRIADRAHAHYDFVMRPRQIPTFKELLNLYIVKHINPDTEEIDFPLTSKKRDYVGITIYKITPEMLYYKRKTKRNLLQNKERTLQMDVLADYYNFQNAPIHDLADYEAVITTLATYRQRQPNTDSKLRNYVLVLDEMQSAHLPTLLGEGLSLLEQDRRTGAPNALEITLPSGDGLRFPSNLYLLGTWNTSDVPLPAHSGLLRRFAWVECSTRYDLIQDVTLRIFCQALNEALERELTTQKACIGHAYFLGLEAVALPTLLQQHLLPLLKELLPNQQKKIAHILQTAHAKAGLAQIQS